VRRAELAHVLRAACRITGDSRGLGLRGRLLARIELLGVVITGRGIRVRVVDRAAGLLRSRLGVVDRLLGPLQGLLAGHAAEVTARRRDRYSDRSSRSRSPSTSATRASSTVSESTLGRPTSRCADPRLG